MKLLMVGTFLVVVGLIIYFSYRSQQKWSVVIVASGDEAYDAQTKYEYLKNCGVRCKVKSDQMAGAAVGIAQAGYAASSETTRVFVRTTELELAQSLLDKFGQV